MFGSIGEYAKAEEYLHKALIINTEIGDRNGEASCYIDLVVVFEYIGEYGKKLKNIFIKHLPSTQKLATETEKRHAI